MYKEHWNACSWLESNWLNIPEVVCSYDVHNQSFVLLHLQKWAHAYRDMAYYAAMETNNGTESLNKALKYSSFRTKITLTIWNCFVTNRHFLPDVYQKYIFQNYKLSKEYREYSDSIPSYLKGHPKSVILYCLHRKLKCHKFSVEDVTMLGGGNFEVHKAGT